MKLTKEQYNIIHSSGNIKINAVAGSGKTTTVIEYAKARPRNSKILYLAFNKSVKLDAIKKFRENGLSNVTVQTAHSLAYKNIIFKNSYKVKHQGYKTHEIASLLKLKGNGEKHTKYIIANHINKFISYFCNSNKAKIQELNYLDIVSDPKAKTFVTTFYKYIETQTRVLLSKMDKGEIEITHDFYLKKFQLSNPKLHYEYILFDEGQDASPAMLDVFLKQKATKVIVGDTHQQIYGWRHAVNSLEKADFKTYHLSTSFRFNQEIADLAKKILNWKSYLSNYKPLAINGKGKREKHKTKAILARTNLGLLLKAIKYVTEKHKIKHIYFEGNIHSYTYADEGTSLYDILNLYNGKNRLIKDKLIKEMKSLNELEDYIKKTEDIQLGLMIEIVKEYGNEIPSIINKIKSKHVENNDKEKAEIIFSTVHRCKGMEYDAIQLVNDFITEEKIEKLKAETKLDAIGISKINEEINLLYVAVTRTKKSIHIPDTLLPKDFYKSSNVHVIGEEKEEKESRIYENIEIKKNTIKKKTFSFEKIRKQHNQAYYRWTTELDDELTVMFCEGTKIHDLSKHFGRTKGAIRSRIKKLELVELYP